MRKAQLSVSISVDVIERFDERVGRGNRSRQIEEWMEAFLDDRLTIMAEPELSLTDEDFLQ